MESIPMSVATLIINALGLSGIIFIIWHFDNKRFQAEKDLRVREMAEREKALDRVLVQYKEDTLAIKRLYENNVDLAKNYEKACGRSDNLFREVMGVISLNSQVYTQLTDYVRHNMFCPMVREKGPQS